MAHSIIKCQNQPFAPIGTFICQLIHEKMSGEICIHISSTTHIVEKIHIFPLYGHMGESLLNIINNLNTVHSTMKFTNLIIYIRGSKLYTRLHTKTTDRHISVQSIL